MVISLFSRTDFSGLLTLALFILAFCFGSNGPALAEDTINVEPQQKIGQYYKVQAQYQHRGTVIVDHAGQDEEAQSLPMKVEARFEYFDRIAGKADDIQSIRFYKKAISNISIDKGNKSIQLDPTNQTIIARLKSSRYPSLQLASIKDSLQQAEFELLNNPADPLSFRGLLKSGEKQVGDKWDAAKSSLAHFVAIDRVSSSDVKLHLKSVENGIAKIYMVGGLIGDVNDVSTEMELSGVIMVDIKQDMVNAIRINIRENRDAGQVAPGFVGDTKVDVRISKAKGIKALSNQTLTSGTQSKSLRNLLKWESEEFLLKYDPAWKLIASEADAAILRFVDRGELLAQCNVVKIASRPPSNPLLLADFKKEVEKIMKADSSARIIDTSQARTSLGHQSLQISVQAEEEGVPLNWIYYNLANKDGRQVTFVFTLEQEIVDRAMPAIAKIVDGFQFLSVTKKASAARDAKVNASTKR